MGGNALPLPAAGCTCATHEIEARRTVTATTSFATIFLSPHFEASPNHDRPELILIVRLRSNKTRYARQWVLLEDVDQSELRGSASTRACFAEDCLLAAHNKNSSLQSSDGVPP